MLFKKKILEAIKNKENKDIFIIGKGPSVDGIDLKILKNKIVININNSEKIFPGDIALFHDNWVLDDLKKSGFDANLYISNLTLPKEINQIKADYISHNPESSDFIMERFFENKFYLEQFSIISALSLAEEISRALEIKKNVYLLGFDFNADAGFSQSFNSPINLDENYQKKIINTQENFLYEILSHKEKLNINVFHIGNKEYSLYSIDSLNYLYQKKFQDNSNKFFKQDELNTDKVKITAEITTNHFGDMDRLKAMIILSKNSGADFIKLQKRDVDTFYTKKQLKTKYKSPFGKTFRDYRMGLELSLEQFEEVESFCKEIGIGWFASILDLPSFKFIQNFNPTFIKIPSTISEHKEFIAHVGKNYKENLVISTGYTNKNYEEFILKNFKNAKKIYLLQCTSAYPTKNDDAQIAVVRHYYNLSKHNEKIIPGYSSHDIGSLCSMMAIAAGAQMIEKHVKFSQVSWSHFDEVAVDLQNGNFEDFVKDIRKAENILGSEIKKINPNEHHKYWI